MLDKNTFAINMKKFRKKLNLSQSEVAKILDINRTSLINYESAKTLPDINLLLRICNLYNCSINDLFDLNPNKNYYNNVPLNSVENIDTKIKNLNNLIFQNIELNNELISMKNKFSLNINKISNSQKKLLSYIDTISDLSTKFESIYSNLIKSIDFYKKSSKDIDETRTYFLNAFSNILENAQILVNDLKESKIDSLYYNNANINEEVSNELVPEINFNDSNYTYINDDNEETVDIDFFDANIAAGKPISCCDIYNETRKLKVRYPITKENADDFYILTVKGNSMNKIVADGEDILIRSTNYVENGTIAAVTIIHVGESECTLKYYYYDPETNLITLKPKSYDPSYKDLIFDAKEQNVIIQGEYIGPISDFL